MKARLSGTSLHNHLPGHIQEDKHQGHILQLQILIPHHSPPSQNHHWIHLQNPHLSLSDNDIPMVNTVQLKV